MEKEIRKKAIEQAQASLLIDGICLSDSFLASYFKKNQLPFSKTPQTKRLVYKRGNKNGK